MEDKFSPEGFRLTGYTPDEIDRFKEFKKPFEEKEFYQDLKKLWGTFPVKLKKKDLLAFEHIVSIIKEMGEMQKIGMMRDGSSCIELAEAVNLLNGIIKDNEITKDKVGIRIGSTKGNNNVIIKDRNTIETLFKSLSGMLYNERYMYRMNYKKRKFAEDGFLEEPYSDEDLQCIIKHDRGFIEQIYQGTKSELSYYLCAIVDEFKYAGIFDKNKKTLKITEASYLYDTLDLFKLLGKNTGKTSNKEKYDVVKNLMSIDKKPWGEEAH